MIEEFYEEFINEITLDAGVNADFIQASFFEKYSETAAENGDFLSLAETHHEGEGIEIDG